MEGFIKQEARARDLQGPTTSWNLTRWRIPLRFGPSSYSSTESIHLGQFDDISADSAKATVPRQFMTVKHPSPFWSSTDFLVLTSLSAPSPEWFLQFSPWLRGESNRAQGLHARNGDATWSNRTTWSIGFPMWSFDILNGNSYNFTDVVWPHVLLC